MTPELKRKGGSKQQRRNERQIEKAAQLLAPAVVNAKNDFIEECAKAFEGHSERHFEGELIGHRVSIKLLLDQSAAIVIRHFGKQTLDDTRLLAAKAADDSFFSRLIDRWIRERGFERARGIAGTTLADVLAALQKGFDEGEGSDAIARRIRDVSKLSKWRALTVARTEAHQAALFAQAMTARQAEEDFGLKLVKVWLPTLDSRTRDAHAAMARHPAIPLDQKFNVSGFLMDRPGDPSAPASLVCNCRCTLIHREAPASAKS